jgi:DNA-binding NtrC family response regulator
MVDDERVREVAAEMLRGAASRVMAAQDVPEAKALLRRGEQFDVSFSDIVMPGGMTGIEQVARRVRPELPVLLATAYARAVEGTTDHAFEAISRPYDRMALVRQIAGLRARRQFGTA